MRELIIEACLSGDTQLFIELRETFPIELLQSELAGLAEHYQKRFRELLTLTEPVPDTDDVLDSTPTPPPPPPEPEPPPLPPEEKQWIPVVGERVLWLQFTTWRPATVKRLPEPKNGFNKWELRFPSGSEVYVSDLTSMKPHAPVATHFLASF